MTDSAALLADGGEGTYFLLAYATIDKGEAENELAKNWGWILACGVLNLVVGILAVLCPVVMTEMVIVWLGIFLVVVGVFHASGYFFADYGFKWQSLALGCIQVLLGVFMFINPWNSLVALTTIIAVAFMCDGVFRIFVACRNQDIPGWGFYMVNGVCSVLLSALVLAYPGSPYFVLGILVGVNMIVLGIARISAGMMGRKLALNQEGGAASMSTNAAMV